MTKIEIDLRDLGLPTGMDHEGEPTGATTLQDLIVRAAVDELVGPDLRREVRQKVEQIVEERATEEVLIVVREVLTGPIQRRAAWGDKVGEPTTVREIIREKVNAFMQAPGRDRYGMSGGPRNLNELVDEATRNILTGELAGTVAEAKAAVHERVTKAALEAAVEVLAR